MSNLNLLRDLVGLVVARRNWWLLPVLLALLLVGALVVLGEVMPLSPFIYPL